ncbi:MAG: TIGR00701 family protein [Rhodobacteraceae bacterium]|nr:MAG: TIGR00701 family protein [Paracoccaceae bacterium]
MSDFLTTLYPWIKSVHVIAVISWMAGMLYLPRLFVYHVETNTDFINPKETLERWEYLLLKRIINPAMVVAWICGLLMVFTPGIIDWSQGWPWVKVISVLVMSGFHGWLSKERKLLAKGTPRLTGRGYRLANEIPTVLMIIIVIMVIARPF